VEIELILPILAIIISIGGFMLQHFVVLSKIMERLSAVETKTGLFWVFVEKELPNILHSPHTPDIDALLEKMVNGKLTVCNARELKEKLKEEMLVPDTGKKIAVALLITRLDQIITEDEKRK